MSDTKIVPATFALSEERSEASLDSTAGKYAVFGLGRKEFGSPVKQQREIMELPDITGIPHVPAQMVIPVMDLRLKLDSPAVEYAMGTCIIVAQLRTAARPHLVGTVVHRVVEVAEIATDDFEDTPKSVGLLWRPTGPSRLRPMAK